MQCFPVQVQRKAEHARSAERVHMEREVMVDARHPLVTPLFSAFQDRLYLYLEMEYCPGGSLDNFLMCVTSVIYLYCTRSVAFAGLWLRGLWWVAYRGLLSLP